MNRQIRPLMIQTRKLIHHNLKFTSQFGSTFNEKFPTFFLISITNQSKFHSLHSNEYHNLKNLKSGYFNSFENNNTHVSNIDIQVQNLLKNSSNSSDEELQEALCGIYFDDDLMLNLLKRYNSDWKLAFRLFNFVSKGVNSNGYLPNSKVFGEMIGILGKMKCFDEVHQVFDEMSKRGIVDERAYGIVVHRYAAAHKVDDAIEFFYKRKLYGFKLDLVAFQTLLMALCRYKHVEVAEYLFLSKRGEFTYDIKTWNILLNGWSLIGNLHETKRFWNEIIRSKCKPDKVTYGIFINSLCKCGKISTAVQLFHAMWKQGCVPDIVICNSVIDGLCFKKRIPEALTIFREMNDKDCQPDVVTYNCLIKHLCKIDRMDKVYELLSEMEEKGGTCSPNARTYCHLLNLSKTLEEVSSLLERMEKTGCKMTGDSYNLLLRLYMNWGCDDKVEWTWNEMMKHGMGPDQRSYTVMIHGLFDQGKIQDALDYFNEMISKGMMPEPRTTVLVDAMKVKLKEGSEDRTNQLSRDVQKKRRKNLSRST